MARNNEENRPMTGLMKRRLNVFVTLFIGLLTAYVGLRLIGVSIVDQDKYKAYAANQQVSSITINANRGTIYDSDMNVLASSATVWTVAVDPSRIDEADRQRVAADLAAILDMAAQKVYDKINQDLQYVHAHIGQPSPDPHTVYPRPEVLRVICMLGHRYAYKYENKGREENKDQKSDE